MAVFSQTNVRMRSFLYRSPRLKTNLSMDFALGEKVVLGTCRSLSESGVAGTLCSPVAKGAEGVLTLYFREEILKLCAVLEDAPINKARLRFVPKDPLDLQKARRFVQLVTDAGSGSGPVLLP